uniref:BHLH domain-containing protein n=1 Tax=Ciona savignyi TaxID=51511 RepID=H2ZDP9_CIOSA
MDNTAYTTMQHHMMASSPMQHEPCYPPSPYSDPTISRDALFFQSIHPAFAGGIENYLDPKYASDPAAFASRLPYFPFHAAYGVYDYGFEPAFIRKRNERERQRVKCVNEGYARLREHLPEEYAEKRLSKVETLRGAIQYIQQLQNLLGVDKDAKRKKRKRKAADDSEKKLENPNSNTGFAKSPPAQSPTRDVIKDNQCDFESKIANSQILTNDKQDYRYKNASCSYSGQHNTLDSSSCHGDSSQQVAHSTVSAENSCNRGYGWSNCELNRFYPPPTQRYNEKYICNNSDGDISKRSCDKRGVIEPFQTTLTSSTQSRYREGYHSSWYPRSLTRNGFENRGGESDGFKSDNSPISSGASP